MKGAKWAALAGIALGTAAVVWLGAGKVFSAMFRIGWGGLGFVVGWQLLVYLVLGIAWWLLCPWGAWWRVTWGRLVREGGTTCLPFSVVGGLAFSIRTLILGGVSLARATASSIVDILSEGVALVPFVLFGLVLLAARSPGSTLIRPAAIGSAVLFLGAALVLFFRRRLTRLLRSAVSFILKHWVKDAPRHAEELEKEIDGLFRSRGRFIAATALHLLCWCGGAGNVYIGYHLLGAKPSLVDALAIEAVFSVVLSAGLLVPGAFGVQEVTYVGIGKLFGMPAHLSLALSLIRRARDIVIGAPALFAWQMAEARRLKKPQGTS